MAYTGRCWYCGSEDVEDYSDGSHECLECGMIWGGRQYNQQSAQHKTYRRTYTKQRYNRQWENSMRQYREKWRNNGNVSTNKCGIVNNGKKWYDAEVQVTKGCAVPAVLYFFIAIMVYGFAGLMLYVACSS